jgi:hypothetical protein
MTTNCHRSSFCAVTRPDHLNPACDRIFLLEDARPAVIPSSRFDWGRESDGRWNSARRLGRNGAQPRSPCATDFKRLTIDPWFNFKAQIIRIYVWRT